MNVIGEKTGLWLYIVECSDRSFYTGVKNDLERRIFEHNEGIIVDCYTHNRRPVKLVYSEEFSNYLDAINREKQVKGWSRAKKKALIENDFRKLKELSKTYHGSQFDMLRQAQHDNNSNCHPALSSPKGRRIHS